VIRRLAQKTLISVPDFRGKTWLLRRLGNAIYDVPSAGPMALSPIHLIDGYIIRTGSYAPELVAEIKRALAGGGDMVDVGANIGYLTLVAARATRDGLVYAFEPSPREFDMLLQNLRLAGARNVVPFPIGLGASASVATLYLQGEGNPSANTRHAAGIPTSIRIERFADVIPGAALPRIRCVKIDVEGDELSVLEGLAPVIDQLQATFVVEVSWPGSAAGIYAFFERHGFSPKFGPESRSLDEIFTRAR
jgi:FkbM family methyltransferase